MSFTFLSFEAKDLILKVNDKNKVDKDKRKNVRSKAEMEETLKRYQQVDPIIEVPCQQAQPQNIPQFQCPLQQFPNSPQFQCPPQEFPNSPQFQCPPQEFPNSSQFQCPPQQFQNSSQFSCPTEQYQSMSPCYYPQEQMNKSQRGQAPCYQPEPQFGDDSAPFSFEDNLSGFDFTCEDLSYEENELFF